MKPCFRFLFASVLALSSIQLGYAASKSGSRLSFSTVQLKTGVRLHYAHQGNKAGRPVILLHGYPDSWFSYSTVLPLLNAKYRVYVLDQRGHGNSERPVRNYSLPTFAADVIAFMNAMGIRRAAVVGHSMGSLIAQHVASMAPDRVDRLVLVGSTTTVHNNEVVLGLQREVKALSDPVSEKFVREFQLSTSFTALPDNFVERVVKESLKLPARVWNDVMTGMMAPDAKADLKKVKMPTLVLWGDRETIFDRSAQDVLLSSLPNAVFKVYPETGHALHWERPAQFARDLEDFIR